MAYIKTNKNDQSSTIIKVLIFPVNENHDEHKGSPIHVLNVPSPAK